MFLLDDVVVFSASDLTVAARCEYAVLHSLDVRSGRVAEDPSTLDPMLERTARLGDVHEARWLHRFRTELGEYDPARGRGVVTIARPPRESYRDPDVLRAKHAETLDALRSGADVVFQGGFFDGRFHGWSDFLVRGPDGSYAVYDAKLARHAKVTAVLQLAAYADQLIRAGVAVAPTAHLILGDHTTTSHVMRDVVPLYRHRRARLTEILDRHLSAAEPATWDDGVHSACGRCDVCQAQVVARRDVLVVAGLRTDQRARLRAAEITTVDQLAAHSGPVAGVADRTLERLRAQARLQVVQDPPHGDPGPVVSEVVDPRPIRELPPADAGDLFFDFEGDPLWNDGDATQWGLEYLFGWVDVPVPGETEPPFHALWAHDRAEERAALEAFVDHVTARRLEHPGMHVYHYAPYETTALTRLVGRHGTREQELDALLRAGVFVDLYSTVRQSIRVSQPSYSIKKLEPLYMTAREGLDNAAESITDYALACEERDGGHHAESQTLLDRIAAYNADDCRSTFLLREWLVAQALGVPAPEPVERGPVEQERLPSDKTLELQELSAALQERAAALEGAPASGRSVPSPEREVGARTYRLLAAALEFWSREEKPAWWAHFARLTQPPDEWSDTRNVVLASEARQLDDWARPARGNPRRRLVLSGELEAGTDIDVGSLLWPLYGQPVDGMARGTLAGRGWNGSGATVEAIESGVGGTSLTVREVLPRGAEPWPVLPMALVPPVVHLPPAPQDAVARLAGHVLAAAELPRSAALDLLGRRPPRVPVPADGEPVDRVHRAVLAADRSYVAVQGPPGTGKTYTASRVIARLVAEGWRVGVVAQSHAVVEHLLDAVVAAGVPAARVGKKPRDGVEHPPWTELRSDGDWSALLADRGCVAGGTTWDFANRRRVPEASLDVLVVDEAGQFSLAATVAAAGAATRLLLLGDPQQLPQVSQGNHPEPVDASALGWLLDGAATIPESLGILLTGTWRMRPELCAAVSALSYDGRLEAMASTTGRSVVGVEPGLHAVLVDHHGNRTYSPEECAAVVALVDDLVGRELVDGAVRRALRPDDVIVVAAYNAQVGALRDALTRAGFAATPVGTVDKFQGREAVVAVVSLAASSADDVPRGVEFLLSRNRLNVAVSRGKVAAYLVHSPRLRDHLPATVAGLEAQGAFVGLSAGGG